MAKPVNVICCTYNRPHLLRHALQSLERQIFREFTVLIVNDGGTDVGDVIAETLRTTDYRYFNLSENIGLAAAINLAFDNATSKYIMFIDDDNEYLPDHIGALYKEATEHNAPLVYSNSVWRYFKNGEVIKEEPWQWEYSPTLLNYQNYIDPVQVMLDAEQLREVGGFDKTLRVSDWDMWLRLQTKGRFIHIPQTTCIYGLYSEVTRLSESMAKFETDAAMMIDKYLRSHERSLHEAAAFLSLVLLGNRNSYDIIPPSSRDDNSLPQMMLQAEKFLAAHEKDQARTLLVRAFVVSEQVDPVFRPIIINKFIDHQIEVDAAPAKDAGSSVETTAAPDVNAASGLSVEPKSRKFGFDRGEPIDRYYIERFLEHNRDAIKGCVLEIGDNYYTIKYNSGVTKSDVLNAVPAENATIIGDLQTGVNIPHNAFDCVILTQTLNVLYDVKAAVRHAVEALKPAGTLLITVPGISQISRFDMDRWGDFWRFTDKSLHMILSEAMPGGRITIETHGNVQVAKAFLDGLAQHEVSRELLAVNDSDYQVIITARATKPARPTATHNEAGKTHAQNPLVLIYHRVADLALDPQLLCVSRDNFESHLLHLVREYRIVPLYQLVDECRKGIFHPNSVALTFDDGYLDNLANALPLLEKHGVHATIFVTSSMVGTDEEFWWDALENIFLTNHPLPGTLEFNGRSWNTDSDEGKITAYEELCALLRPATPETVAQALEHLFSWAAVAPRARPSHRTLNHQQLMQLAASPQIEIGAHAKHHVRLSSLPPHRQRMEITSCKQQLETVVGHPLRLFSYPFGAGDDFTAETASHVAAAGFDAAIANIQADITPPFHPFAVTRRLVRNWDGVQFAEWLHSSDKGALEAKTVEGRRHMIHQALSKQREG